MGQYYSFQPVQEPAKPQPTMKQQVKQYIGQISQTRREQERQKFRIQHTAKILQKKITKMQQKDLPKSQQRKVAKQLLKQQQIIKNFESMDNKQQNMVLQLQQMTVNQSMVNVIAGMATIMEKANKKMGNQNYQQTMKKFMTEKEKMTIMNQMAQDMMEGNDEEIEDADVDQLLNNLTKQGVARKQKKLEQNMDFDDYENQLRDI